MTAHLFHGKSWELLNIEQIDTEPGPFPWQLWPTTGINCLLTDPPYGVKFQSTYNKNPETKAKYNRLIEDDDDPYVAIERFDQTLHAVLPHLAAECEIYIFSQWQVAPRWQDYLETLAPLGIELRQLIIWEKGYPGIGDVKYNWGCGHEFIYYLKKGSRPIPYRRSGILHVPDERPQLPAVIEVDKVRPGTNIHPTEKPVELLKILIEYSTNPGDWILDPYAGSGSTLKAARELGRNVVGIEKDEHYFKDASKRLEEASFFG